MAFAFRLAKELGWFDVYAMLDSAEAGMLEEWMEYNRREPFGKDWEQVSVLLSNLLNALKQLTSLGQPLSEDDIIPNDFFVPRPKNDEAEGRSGVLPQPVSRENLKNLGKALCGVAGR